MKPLIKEDEKVCNGARVCLVDGRNFLDDMKHQHMCYALIPIKDKEGSIEVLVEVSGLLSEYGDIISNNVPKGLLLARQINHQIDLVPRASFPNKAAHKMTPTETEELNKQVQELLRKGMIQESPSPCAVPPVLAPKKDGEWRMCTKSQAINKITIKYWFPLPRMDDLIDCLSGAQYFTKIDLKSG